MESKKRIKWLDFAKGFVILLVVLAHCMQFIYSFNSLLVFIRNAVFIVIMPCFFAISGYLFNPVNTFYEYIYMIYKKASSFLIPYIVFSMIYLLLYGRHSIKGYINIFSITYIPCGYLWFLYSLFFIFIIVGFLDLLHLPLNIQIIFSILLFMFQAKYSYQELMPNGNVTPLAGIFGYIMFFYAGILLNRYINMIKRKVLNIKALPILIIIWILLLIFRIFVSGITYNAGAVDVVTYSDVLPKFISVALLFNIFVNLNQSNLLFKYFDKYGKQSLVIYLVHFVILVLVSKILIKFGVSPYFYNIYKFILYLLIGWFGSVFVCYFSKRVKIVNFIFYPRKYINKVFVRTRFGKRLLNVNLKRMNK